MAMRLLLLEDEWMAAEMVQKALTHYFPGVVIEHISTESAFHSRLAEICQNPPDIAVMDIMVRWDAYNSGSSPAPQEVQEAGPFRGGLRCQKLLTAQQETRDVPVILYSVLGPADIQKEGVSLPDHVVVVEKEDDPSRLIKLIRSMTQLRASTRLHDLSTDSNDLPPMAASSSSSERPAAPISLFYSYSKRDKALRGRLETHLSLLQDQGVISGWHDRAMEAGTEWDGTISKHLEEAGIILLLVSADFLATRYIRDKEIARAMERHEEGAARVIPVILRPVDAWHTAPFGKLQALPEKGKAVTTWKNRDEAFADIARGIREAARSLGAVAQNPPTRAQPAEELRNP